MRHRWKSISSCLGVAIVAGSSALIVSSWEPVGDATAQEIVRPAPPQERSTAAPRDVSAQPLAVSAELDEEIVTETRIASAAAGLSAEPPAPDTVTVMVDHAKVVRLPERTQTVIVGNPIVADIAVQRNGILVVTGKSYGTTNLIALDNSGLLLAESMISVQAPTDSVVTVQRGLARESYSCTPTCQPSLRLGDSPDYFGGVGNQATQRNTLATQR